SFIEIGRLLSWLRSLRPPKGGRPPKRWDCHAARPPKQREDEVPAGQATRTPRQVSRRNGLRQRHKLRSPGVRGHEQDESHQNKHNRPPWTADIRRQRRTENFQMNTRE